MSEIEIKSIRPGILVAEKVTISGGIHYDKELEESYFEDERQIRKWRTTAIVDDVSERQKAQMVRSQIYSLTRKVCASTPIGLICSEERSGELAEALREARRKRNEFNSEAKTCYMRTHHALFEVNPDNKQAVEAIVDHVADIANRVDEAITSSEEEVIQKAPRSALNGLDWKVVLQLPEEEKDVLVARARASFIRKAIADAKGIETLLPEEASKELKSVVRKSKAIATKICKKMERKRASLQTVLNEVDLSGIRKTRTAFIAAAIRARREAESSSEAT